MLQINIKSPDRVNVLLLLDELGAGQCGDKSTGPSDYAVFCAVVDLELLRARLKQVCVHPFTLTEMPVIESGGGSM